MTTKKNLVKQVLMSTLTAVSFSFGFTACSDDVNESDNFNAPSGQTRGDYSQYESYGLSYQDFDSADDVQILNADTTEISVKKSLADKLGITNFVNHPMGIYHSVNQLPYIRKATAQELVGDRYILSVVPATIAELVGDKHFDLQTDIYVNQDAGAVKTRAASSNIPEYAAKYIDANNVVHPAAILLTDPYGYDKDVHFSDDQPSASQTRAAQNGEYQYMTAEELAAGNTRWGTRCRLIDVDTEIKKDFKFAAKGRKDSMQVTLSSEVQFGLNYFINLEGGVKWSGILPNPYVKKFETGVDGHFGLNAEVELAYEAKMEIKEDQLKYELCKFPSYTFTFFIGPLPVAIRINPNMFMKVDGEVSGKAKMGFTYEYGNKFMGGVRYTSANGWEGMSSFEEIANEFNMTPARLEFNLKAGVGLYLGADVLIYGCAGPKVHVGPRLGGEVKAAFTPFETSKTYEDWKDIYEFNAQVDLGINAVIGAKLSVLGYELAEQNVTIKLIEPWVLFKFPSDGTEHKSPKGPKEAENKNLYTELLDESFKTDSAMHNRYEETVTMLMDLNGGMRQQAEDNIYNEVKKTVNITEAAGKDQLRSDIYFAIHNYHKVVKPQHEAQMKDKNWKEFAETLKQMPDYQKYVNHYYNQYRVKVDLDLLHKHFVQKNGDEPLQTQQDFQIFVYYLQRYGEVLYQNSPELQKLYPKEVINKIISLYDFKTISREHKEIAVYETLLSMRFRNIKEIDWNSRSVDNARHFIQEEYRRNLLKLMNQ